MTQYVIEIDDAYVVPEGDMTTLQYLTFVMNKAAESYRNQYSTVDFASGIVAARDAYNATVPEPIE